MASMALNNNVTNREPQYSASNISDKYITVENMCNAMINDNIKNIENI